MSKYPNQNLAQVRKVCFDMVSIQLKSEKNEVSWLQAYRKALGLSRKKLSLRLTRKLSEESIYKFESSEKSGAINLEALILLAEGLGCSVRYSFVPVTVLRQAKMQGLVLYKNNIFLKLLPGGNKSIPINGISHYINRRGMIYETRTKMRLSYKELGKRFETSISPQAIYTFERNEVTQKISLKSLAKLAEALESKFVYLIEPLDLINENRIIKIDF